MGAPTYAVMSSEIIIDSSTSSIVVKAGGSTETLDISPGSYYFTGESTTSIADAVAAAIQIHTNIATCTAGPFTFEINDFNQPTCRVTFSGSTSFELLVLDASNTFDWQLVGFSVASSLSATPAGDCEIKGLWVADQPAANEFKGPFTAEVSQQTALDGTVYTFKRGTVEQMHGFSFDFIIPWKVLNEEKNPALTEAQNGTFQSFHQIASDGRGVRIHQAEVDTSPPSATGRLFSNQIMTDGVTWVGQTDWVLNEKSATMFAPRRFSAGLELYSFPVRIRKKV